MRGLRIFSIVFVVLLVILVAADFIGRSVAETKIAEAFQKNLATTSAPDVSVGGFSVLAQAVGGTYSQITIRSDAVPVQDVGTVGLDIDASDIDLPLSKLLDGDLTNLVVGTAVARVDLPVSVVADKLGGDVKLSSLGGTKIAVEADQTVAGVTIPIKGELEISAAAGVVDVKVDDLKAFGVGLPSAALAALSDQLTFSFDLPPVVKAITLTDIAIAGDTITLTGSGTNVPLN